MSKFVVRGREVPKHGRIVCLMARKGGRMWEVYKVSHLRACANTGASPVPEAAVRALSRNCHRATENMPLGCMWFIGLRPDDVIRAEVARQRRAIIG